VTVRILIGDCRDKLSQLPDGSVNCCVTSPPYFRLRDYGHEGQMGLEPTPDEFVAGMVDVFREVRRVLRDDGTCWINIGDSYSRSQETNVPQTKNQTRGKLRDLSPPAHIKGSSDGAVGRGDRPGTRSGSSPPKQLLGIPWRLAFALQADGWFLRQDIIWSKPNPMPESVRDRCTKAHEYLFLLSKGPRYYYDADAIAEPLAVATVSRLAQDIEGQKGSDRVPGKTNGTMKAVGKSSWKGSCFDTGKTGEHQLGRSQPTRKRADRFGGNKHNGDTTKHSDGSIYTGGETRNKRSVWEVATQPFREAHFATYPPALIEPCILAGCPKGGTVLDPFGGAGTTGLVADRLQRDAILIELNPEYAEIASKRLSGDGGMFSEVLAA
jgi:DNA modification methylase